MNNNLIITKSQLDAAEGVLAGLRQSVAPEFLGLIASSGHAITFHTTKDNLDTDAMSSLAASSFAATRQLARIAKGTEFTVMFHEGSDLNVHIAQVSEEVLLVVCFSKASEIGKVRLVSKKAAGRLNRIMKPQGEQDGAD